MAMQIPPFRRTRGDGMEKVDNEENSKEETIILQPREIVQSLDGSETVNQKGSTGITIKRTMGSAVKVVPTQAIDQKKKNILGYLKNKEPKFVPYEPYKAAVRPMVPVGKVIQTHNQNKKKKKKTTTTEEKDLSEIFTAGKKNTDETTVKKPETEVRQESDVSAADWSSKVKAMESEMRTLREENQQLENQLKFQVQVNGELKNLLVAAVGEDMETKVNVLTEDKLHLAQALLRSSESLTSHQEQTEWLAGQCEVWRSKFLASSVMVEELARWKSSLCQKVNEAHEALRKFLDERKQVREKVMKTHANLLRLRDNFDLLGKKDRQSCSNLLDVFDENLKSSDTLIVQLLGSKKSEANPLDPPCANNCSKTPAEKSAEHVLANPNLLQLTGKPDAACTAVMDAAVNLSGQLYLQNHPPKIECCPQCIGEIKLV